MPLRAWRFAAAVVALLLFVYVLAVLVALDPVVASDPADLLVWDRDSGAGTSDDPDQANFDAGSKTAVFGRLQARGNLSFPDGMALVVRTVRLTTDVFRAQPFVLAGYTAAVPATGMVACLSQVDARLRVAQVRLYC